MNTFQKELYKNKLFLGYQFYTENFSVVFGSKNLTKELIESYEPNIQWVQLKQVHEDTLVHSTPDTAEIIPADAHWTDHKNLGLLIQTADCIPLFIYDKSLQKIIAIHAGWRGVEKKIVPQSILQETQADSELDIFIGPCIQKESFEVDKDVYLRLINSSTNAKSFSSLHKDTQKYHLDLIQIVEDQIKETKRRYKIHNLKIDTYTDARFSSFRKEKGPCRNWSFIVKANKHALPFDDLP